MMSGVDELVEGILGEAKLDLQDVTYMKTKASTLIKAYKLALAEGLKNAEKLQAAVERNWKDIQRQVADAEDEEDYPGDEYGFGGLVSDLTRQMEPLKRVLRDLDDHANNQANF